MPDAAGSLALPGIEKPREELFAAVDDLVAGKEPTPFVLAGAQASGRRTLLQSVSHYARGKGQPVFDLEILPFGHDTPARALLQIAALEPTSSSAKVLITLEAPWKQRLDAARAILEATQATVFLVRFPAGAMPAGER